MKKKNCLYRANKQAKANKCPVCQVLFNIGNRRMRKSPNPDLCPDDKCIRCPAYEPKEENYNGND